MIDIDTSAEVVESLALKYEITPTEPLDGITAATLRAQAKRIEDLEAKNQSLIRERSSIIKTNREQLGVLSNQLAKLEQDSLEILAKLADHTREDHHAGKNFITFELDEFDSLQSELENDDG